MDYFSMRSGHYNGTKLVSVLMLLVVLSPKSASQSYACCLSTQFSKHRYNNNWNKAILNKSIHQSEDNLNICISETHIIIAMSQKNRI